MLKQNRHYHESKIKEDILKGANIIVSTLNYCGGQIMDCLLPSKNNDKSIINMVLIDEVILLFTTILIKVKIFNNFIINNKAAQSLEVESLIPLRYGCNKMLFVGDPVQLPATVLSKTALEKGLG